MARMRSAVASASFFFTLAGTGHAEPPTAATWQKHEYRFVAMSFTSTYSCDGLADKLKLLLLTAGARKDVKSLADGCPAGFGRPDRLASARVIFYTLAPVDAATTPDKPVNGAWRSVTVRPRTPRDLGVGDCEIVEQFRDRLLPMFTTRNLVEAISCVPHQLSGSNFNMTFEVLTPPPAPPPTKAP